MLDALKWLFVIEVFGVITLPLAMRLLRHLPDRGYAFAKPLGLLLISYVLWILVSFGLLRNQAISIVLIMIALAVVSSRVYREDKERILAFLKSNAKLVLVSEVIFILAFAGWALFRAYNPQLDSTERPMDLAFLNAIVRSDRFPPNDPWLSGFAISYYYFGYLMMAVLTKLTAIPGPIAFNLAVALLFALTISGSFSLVYNLIEKAKSSLDKARSSGSSMGFGLLGAFMVTVMGNLQIALDMLHARGLGSAAFWKWLDLKKMAEAPITGRWIPTDPPDSWWWWRASRVIHDRDLLGRDSEVIDEFPSFSYLLGDMHPHVLGLPFVLLALGLALNVLFGFEPVESPPDDGAEDEQPRRMGAIGRFVKRAFGILRANAFNIVVWAICLGGLSFLNTWDFPIYLFIFLAALALRRHLSQGRIDWQEMLIYTGWIFGLGVVAYIPFYIGFRSQAGGILPVLYNVTPLNQYLIMFGMFIFCLLSFLVVQWRQLVAVRKADGSKWMDNKSVVSTGLQILAGIVLLPVLGSSLAVFLVTFTSQGRAFLQELMALPEVQEAVGGQTVGTLVKRFAMMRLQDPWLFLLLVGMVTAAVVIIWQRLRLARAKGSGVDESWLTKIEGANLSVVFVGLIATVGLLLTLVTEFVYLRDLFGTRMNTIFKFWYQAWLQMGIASAFAVWYILRGQRHVGRYLWAGGFALLFCVGMVYPLAGMYSKAHQFQVQPTLNGIAYMQQYRPADYAAIQWLQKNVQGSPFILEAPGGSYSQYGRISSQTGLPTVLGWDFHEQQWRGSYDEPAKRLPDIETIYKSTDLQVVQNLLAKYDVQYVYIGDLERTKYGLQPPMLSKFDRIMDKIYDQDGVLIYERR